MIIPLVPPAAANAAVPFAPRFFHVTLGSVVMAPGAVIQVGALPPDFPVAAVQSSMLSLASKITVPTV
jgi:hypothetical protein